jgi:hypothetical protein
MAGRSIINSVTHYTCTAGGVALLSILTDAHLVDVVGYSGCREKLCYYNTSFNK